MSSPIVQLLRHHATVSHEEGNLTLWDDLTLAANRLEQLEGQLAVERINADRLAHALGLLCDLGVSVVTPTDNEWIATVHVALRMHTQTKEMRK